MSRVINNRKRGKRAQKEIAKLLEGLDIGILGKADILTELFIVEVKHRKTFIGESFLQEAENYQKEHKLFNKIPIAVIHTFRKKYEDSIVCIRLKDFLSLLKENKSNEQKI
ncbi:MAG: hypothetical protein QXT86_08875 [Archaeoglobaceae archaeon]